MVWCEESLGRLVDEASPGLVRLKWCQTRREEKSDVLGRSSGLSGKEASFGCLQGQSQAHTIHGTVVN